MKLFGEYTHKTVARHVCNFARVAVKVDRINKNHLIDAHSSNAVSVIYDSANPDVSEDWIRSATEGIHWASKELKVNPNEYSITLVKTQGHLADTTENTVWCSAVLATWRAFSSLHSLNEPKLEFRNGGWYLVFNDGRVLNLLTDGV